MEFHLSSYRGECEPCFVVLTPDSWDDYGYRTSFDVTYYPDEGNPIYLGHVKIVKKDQSVGSISLPEPRFNRLPKGYASLGQTLEYYRKVAKLPKSIRKGLLYGLRDLATQNAVISEFEKEPVFEVSLLRSSEAVLALSRGEAIVYGRSYDGVEHPQFEFISNVSNVSRSLFLKDGFSSHKVNVDFSEKGKLPHRVNVWVGRNGTGKTRLLASLAEVISGLSNENGYIEQSRPKFSRVIAVSYSPFDKFYLPSKEVKGSVISYKYFGLRSIDGIYDPTIFSDEMINAIKEIDRSGSRSVLSRFLEVVIPGAKGQKLLSGNDDAKHVYATMSAGQRLVTTTIISVLGFLEKNSLLLIDEPETHLHPGLLTSFIEVLHEILKEYESYAIIATHSPIILQQVPSRFVRVFRRLQGGVTLIHPLKNESFGASLDGIMSEVLELANVERDYRSILEALANEYSFEEIEEMFDNKLSFNARTYLNYLFERKVSL